MTISTTGKGDRGNEWLFAVMMVAWGFYLWLPFHTFSGPQYALLKAVANEVVWGSFSISIGLLRVVALAINGHMRHTPIARCIGAGLGTMWWMVLTFMFLTGSNEPPPAGVVWYPIFMFAEFLIVLRSGADIFLSGALERRPRFGFQ